MIYTEKQKELLRIFKSGGLKRLNLLYGSVRSGKTWISLVLWAFLVASMPKDKAFIMTGKTLTSLKRNCLDVLTELVGTDNFNYALHAKEGRLFGRKVYLEGVNDVRAEDKIRGLTLQGAYCDEVTLYEEAFFKMLLTRLSENGAKFIGTTNPDNPSHWLKKNYIDNKKLDMLSMKFLLDENTTLSREFIENTKKENTGVFYDRFILGEWVAAEGLIYRLLADNPERYMIEAKDVPELRYINVGEDFGGNKSGHAIVRSGINGNTLFFTHAKYKPAKGTTATELTKWSINCFEEMGGVFDIYADSAEQVLINELRTKTNRRIYNSLKLPIVDRIRFLNMLLSTDRVKFVLGETETLIEALSAATWDDKKITDTRLDNGTYNNDIIDAAEYSFEYNMARLVRM